MKLRNFISSLLSSITSLSFEAPLSWLLPLINGALVLGFVFGRLFIHLPGRTALAKGAAFGLAAWLAMGLGLMLAMLMTYSIVMSLFYAWLTTPLRTKAQGQH